MTLNSWSSWSCVTAGITGMQHHVQAIWNQEIEIICICSLMFLVDQIDLPCCLWLPPITVIFPFFLPAPSSTTEKAQSRFQCSPIHHHSPWSITSKRGFFLIQLSAFSELRLSWHIPSLLNAHQQHYTLKLLVCVFHFISHKFRQEPSVTASVVNVLSKPPFLCFQLKLTV